MAAGNSAAGMSRMTNTTAEPFEWADISEFTTYDFELTQAEDEFFDNIYLMVGMTALQVLMTIAGTVGNSLVLAAVFLFKKLHSPANMFIVNLAICDMLVSIVSNPFAIVGTIYGREFFYREHLLCRVVGSICVISCQTSCINILHISVNRYVALIHKTKYIFFYTYRKVIIICVLSWLVFIIYNIPTHIGLHSDMKFDERFRICLWGSKFDQYPYRLVLLAGSVATPLVCVFLLYVKIFSFVRTKKRAMIEKARLEGMKMKSQMDDTKLAKTLFFIYLAFVTCWALFAITVIFDVHRTWPLPLYLLGVTLAHLSSSGVNPVIYGLTNKNFKRAFQHFFKVFASRFFKAVKIRPLHTLNSMTVSHFQSNNRVTIMRPITEHM